MIYKIRDSSIKYLTLIIGSSIYFYLFTRVLWRVGDEGSIVYGAALVADGAIPFKDFFEVMGPLTFFWLGSFFKLFGTKLIVARMVLLFTGVSMVLLIYFLTRRYYKGSFDYLPAVLYTTCSIPLWPANSHHWDSNLFALISISLFLIWWRGNSLLFLFFSGIIAGITTCFIPHKGLFIFSTFAVLVLVENKYNKEKSSKLISKLSTLISSYAVVGILVIWFYHINDALTELIYANLIWPLSQYHKVNVVPYSYGLKEHFFPNWLSTLNSIFPSTISLIICCSFFVLFAIILLLPVFVVLTFILERIFQKKNHFFNYDILPIFFCGITLWLSELHRMGIMNILYGSPILIILFFLMIFFSFQKIKYIKNIILGAISICIIFFGSYNALIALSAKETIVTRRGEIYSFKKDYCLEFLSKETREGDLVFVYPYYPMYYFMANIKNPTRFSILMYNINTKAQISEVISDLKNKEVEYVLWDTFVSGQRIKEWFPNYQHPLTEDLDIERYLQKNYRIETVENGFRIMKKIP